MQTLLQTTFHPKIQDVGLLMKIFTRRLQNSLWIRPSCLRDGEGEGEGRLEGDQTSAAQNAVS